MPIAIADGINNMTPYDVVFVGADGENSKIFPSKGTIQYSAELFPSPVTKSILRDTGGTPVELDACTAFFCIDQEGALIDDRLPKTRPGQFLLIEQDVAARCNEYTIFRGIIFPKEYEFMEGAGANGRRLMLIKRLGTFWKSRAITTE